MNPDERHRILLVEDDLRLAELIRDFLEASDALTVELEPRGDLAVERILEDPPDLLILDIMLPGLDGLSVCRQVRESYPGPILMLSALGEEVDEVVGLELGADDYVAKPASPRKILARVRSLLRRVPAGEQDGVGPSGEGTLTIGDLTIEPARRGATMAGEELDLTTAEFDLLLLLARHAGEALDRETIYRLLRGIEWDGLDRSLDLRILRLRKKLGDDARAPRWIKSVRGVGYMMARPSEAP